MVKGMKVQSVQEIRAYLLARVKKMHGCWLWTRALDRGGYGLCWADGRHYRAARLAYEVFVGPIPLGYQIHHTCPNRNCINPDHLEPKELREHFKLHSASGSWSGTKNSQAKLNEAAAQFILNAGPWVPARDLADRFGVSRRTVYNIRSGGGWNHVHAISL